MTAQLANTKALLDQVFSLRQKVFVVEQKVDASEEFDEFEDISRHWVVLEENLAVGTCRWRHTTNGIKLERFAVKETRRGKGIGSSLVEAAIRDIQEQAGKDKNLYLHAQLDAIPLYEKYGFSKEGEMFEECNIQHYLMRRKS
ncbi:MAG: GNAT family N-acetyltransferase [Cyclobacteriaceae bacterium]